MDSAIRFFLQDHQGKGRVYRNALVAQGWRETWDPTQAQISFWDSDVAHLRQERLNKLPERQLRFIYPHAARPPIFYDIAGLKEHPGTTAVFVHAEGHLRVLKSIGFQKPIHVTGWGYGEVRPFRGSNGSKRIVFAPIHTTSSGWMAGVDKSINVDAMAVLVRFKRAHPEYEIVVRYLHNLNACGLVEEDGFIYVQGKPDQSIREIESAGWVIAHQTYAFLAVSLGVPTIMLHEDIAPRVGHSEENLEYVQNWDAYKDIMSYPAELDLLQVDEKDIPNMLQRASLDSNALQSWRKRMIGNAFDASAFVQTVQTYMETQ